jgi:hypothetical protein
MKKIIQRTFFHILKGFAHKAILLVVSLTVGMAPVVCQTPADADSLNAVGLSWKVDMDESPRIPEGASTRYFIAPSAFQIQQGQGRIQSNVAHNVVHVGVTDRLAVTGMEGRWASGFGLKTSWHMGKGTRVSLVAMGLGKFPAPRMKRLLLGGLVVTRGDDVNHVSFGLGLTNQALMAVSDRTYYSDEATDEARRMLDEGDYGTMVRPQFRFRSHQARMLVFNLSRIWEVRPGFWLLSENYLLTNRWFGHAIAEENDRNLSPETYLMRTFDGDASFPGGKEEALVSFGCRSYRERSGLTFDYGLAVCYSQSLEWLFPIPWFSMALDFSRTNP